MRRPRQPRRQPRRPPRSRTRRHANPVYPRTTTAPLYRSISPLELIEILKSGRIVGRGNTFSGDDRDLVFFADADTDLKYQGEDMARSIYSDPAVAKKFDALHTEERALEAERRRINPRDQMWLPAAAQKALDTIRRAQDRNTRSLRALQKSLDAKGRKRRDMFLDKYGVTSFIVELHDAPGGIVYDGGDTRHLGTEIGFERVPGVDARYIAAVYPVRWSGTYGQPVEVLPPVSLREAAAILHKKAPRWAK